MLFSRAWWALMRRNAIYRKRHWINSIFELLLPFCFVYILVAIRNASRSDTTLGTSLDAGGSSGDENATTTTTTPDLNASTSSSSSQRNIVIPKYLPSDYEARIPFSYHDYIIALRAKRICNTYVDDVLDIIGWYKGGYDWQVPFIQCDSRLCEYLLQDAKPFCEYSFLAVSGMSRDDEGGRHRAFQFRTWMHRTWPVLKHLDLGFDFVQVVNSPEWMDEYIQRPDYGTPGVPKIGIGIVFDGNSTDHFKYWIRQNSTYYNTPEGVNTANPMVYSAPPTDRLFAPYATSDFEACRREIGAPSLGHFQDSCTGMYFYNGVIATQRLVGDFILNETGATAHGYRVADGGVSFVQFPHAASIKSGFFTSIEQYSALLIVLGILYPVAVMIRFIVGEKELRQKELMKMMSVTESDIGWSWFASLGMFHVFSAVLAAIASGVLYEKSSLSILVTFWVLSLLNCITFAIVVSAVTSKTAQGVFNGVLIFFAGYFLTLVFDYRDGNSTILRVISLHPVAAFSYGIKQIGFLEDMGTGLVPETLRFFEGKSEYSFLTVLSFLELDAVLAGIMSWYLNRVIQPEYGQSLPFWFPFSQYYWMPHRKNDIKYHPRHNNDSDEEEVDARSESSTIPTEPVSDVLRRQSREGRTIEMCNLHKSFKDKVALDGLNLSMYSGHITALLGRNGAGKSTTINLLTGAIDPSNGYATINGKDIRTQMTEIREDMGICLQHDCLFPDLTVLEHMQFYGRLKGMYSKLSNADAEKQINQALADVALGEKRNTLSKNLSGGMKRKLSVAIAFCGGSSVVLLDEPTSGMDPFSRRFIWNVIRHYRQDRCIVLTTHFMDEADVLGDRIAILSAGKLCCVGSPLFLKKRYGVGYQLTIVRSQPGEQSSDSVVDLIPIGQEQKAMMVDEGDEETDLDQLNGCLPVQKSDSTLQSIVMQSVPEASLLSDAASELTLQLPFEAASKFSDMFKRLDALVEERLIETYGISVTTLNEVFLLVTRAAVDKVTPSGNFSTNQHDENNETGTAGTTNTNCTTSFEGSWRHHPQKKQDFIQMELDSENLFFRHMRALIRKRALYFVRDKTAWLCTTIAPSLFVMMGFLLLKLATSTKTYVPLTLDLRDYNADLKHKVENRIVFNSPSMPFMCQPGICSHREPYVESLVTDEKYLFCGYEGKLVKRKDDHKEYKRDNLRPTNLKCEISESAQIAAQISESGTVREEADVQNISEASSYLLDNANGFASTKYGAIWFTHSNTSIITSNSTRFTTAVMDQCKYARYHLKLNYSDCSKFGGVGYVIQYNYTALHSALMYESLANEALVRHATSNEQFKVETTIHPFPITAAEKRISAGENAFVTWFLVVMGFPLIAGACASFIVSERESKAKHLQTVAGVRTSAYWLSTFVWDLINYQLPLWTMAGLMFLFDVQILITQQRDIFSGVLAIMILFGPAAAGFSYCASFAFTSAKMCNIIIIIVGFLVGMGGPLTCYILLLIARDPRYPNPTLENVSDVLSWILRLSSPFFCLGKGIFAAINIENYMFIYADDSLTAWSAPILLYEAYILGVQCIGYVFLAMKMDKWSTNPRVMSRWRYFSMMINCRFFQKSRDEGEYNVLSSLPDDEDVVAEEEAVVAGQSDRSIILKQLGKVYENGKVAVESLSLGISPGEVFGLLGINGAGKTTTLQMLTAEFPPTNGDAFLKGYSVVNEPHKTRRRLGYCPQFDAHFPRLTGREHVEIYASIKGVPPALVRAAAAAKLEEVGLHAIDSDRLSSTYSGGMKRRLSLACATIGQPQVIFLDECTTGVDPVARLEIWQLVSGMAEGHGLPQSDRPSFILTTHNMAECEALCSRIGIMANGRLRCIGSAQHLKSKFGQNYQVELNLNVVKPVDADYASALEAIESALPFINTANHVEVFLNLEQCLRALKQLSGDSSLSCLVSAEGGTGFFIWKDATSSAGVSLDELAAFATSELRMQNIDKFFEENFEKYIFRERQDTKARYEVDCAGIKISDIFDCIERHKDEIRLADYSVSQTSLEQVFNMHAAEAQRREVVDEHAENSVFDCIERDDDEMSASQSSQGQMFDPCIPGTESQRHGALL